MIINVLINYGGTNTQERRIKPGLYAIDDPALYGVGAYLLTTGQAVVVEVDPPPVSPTEPDEVDEAPPKKKGGRS